MSQTTARFGAHDAHGAHGPAAGGDVMKSSNVMPPVGLESRAVPFFIIGLIGLAVTAAAGFVPGLVPGGLKHAVAAYHVGSMAVLAMCLGATFYVMIFHVTMAGWSVPIRRQFENVMVLTPVAALLVAIGVVVDIAAGGHLFAWANKEIVGIELNADALYDNKRGYLNIPFFFARMVVYFVAWSLLTRRLWTLSTEQDRTGDKWLTNKARFTSSWGLLVFALTTAFAAFDWLMSVDYRFFSTMWGVYYFAGGVFASVPLVVLMLVLIQGGGRLRGAVTEEHYHDLAKLMFAFTVFWAYIGFSQYFLIWYSNIPEETSFFLARKTGGWNALSTFLVVGHFIVPWYLLLWRGLRRWPTGLVLMSLWLLLAHFADIYWIVRPMVYAKDTADKVHLETIWLDIAGVVGVAGVFAGLLIRKIASGPLMPLHDPRLPEGLTHRNYV